jgi:hypothetical protein
MGRDEDDEDLERLATERRLRAGFRVAARRALAFARLYREEEGRAGGERERACLAQARAWRLSAHGVRVPSSARPGLARTRATEAAPSKVKAG